MNVANKVTEERLAGASGDSVIVLSFTGDISSASKDAILGTYQGLNKGPNQKILFNFQAVEYLNSSGISLIIQVLMIASKAGEKVSICGLSPHFVKVFTMVGIPKYASLHGDQAAALAAL
jgi:anti-sigma B factor antagonist